MASCDELYRTNCQYNRNIGSKYGILGLHLFEIDLENSPHTTQAQ